MRSEYIMMRSGYVERGNIDREIYAPKGQQQVAGHAIGILCVDGLWNPLPPGCVENATTWDFPVLFKIVEETAQWGALYDEAGDQFSPEMGKVLIAGAKELERRGVRAISGSCGFMANFQKEVAAAVDVPVFLSSLCQIPLLRQGLGPSQKIGIITSRSDLLGPRTFNQVGIDDMSDLAIVGAQDCGEFYKAKASTQAGHYNPFKVEQDIANLAKQFVENNPEISIILVECAILPPYSWAIQNAVGRPVFDYYTLIDWMYKGMVRRPFGGYY